MSGLFGLLTIYDGDYVFSGFFCLEFAVLAYYSFMAVIKAVRMDYDIRRRYSERAEFLQNFFTIHRNRQLEHEEELRLEEEAKQTRVAASQS